jgi:hypothetical protein
MSDWFRQRDSLSRECLNLSCLPKPSFADMVCRVGDMSATCLWSCCWLGNIACWLECLKDTTNGHLWQNSSDLDHKTMTSSPAGSCHGLWWTDALDPVHFRDPDIKGNTAMYWVGGVRSSPQPEKFHFLGVTFCMHNITRKSIIN